MDISYPNTAIFDIIEPSEAYPDRRNRAVVKHIEASLRDDTETLSWWENRSPE